MKQVALTAQTMGSLQSISAVDVEKREHFKRTCLMLNLVRKEESFIFSPSYETRLAGSMFGYNKL